jgi:hypothetical protein
MSPPATTVPSEPESSAEAARPILFVQGVCATAGGSFVFTISNLGPEPALVDLIFNGAPLDVEILDPGELVEVQTDAPGTLVASAVSTNSPTDAPTTFQADSSNAPCAANAGTVSLAGLCRNGATGFHWLLGSSGPAPVDVEVRQGGAVVGTFTVAPNGFVTYTTQTGDVTQALVGGQVVAEAPGFDSPCVQLRAECVDSALGFVFSVSNVGGAPASVEVVLPGPSRVAFQLDPFASREVASPVEGTALLFVGGALTQELTTSSAPCGPTLELHAICFAPRGNFWLVRNRRGLVVDVELRLNGQFHERLQLGPFDSETVGSRSPGTMQAFVNGVVVAEATELRFCGLPPSAPPPAVDPAQLPGTGMTPTAWVAGFGCLAAGLLVVGLTRWLPTGTVKRSRPSSSG